MTIELMHKLTITREVITKMEIVPHNSIYPDTAKLCYI